MLFPVWDIKSKEFIEKILKTYPSSNREEKHRNNRETNFRADLSVIIVVEAGFEPATFAMSTQCSNQLSYPTLKSHNYIVNNAVVFGYLGRHKKITVHIYSHLFPFLAAVFCDYIYV